MTSKLLIIKSSVDYSGCEGCFCDAPPEISTSEVSLTDLVSNTDFQWELAALVEKTITDKNPAVMLKLKQLGFVNKKEIEDRATKLEAEKKFWMLRDTWNSYEIDLSNLDTLALNDLVLDDARVVQSISKASLKELMTEEQRKAYTKAVAAKKAAKEKAAEAKKAKLEVKRLKEVEKAKKILEEAGIN